MAADLGLISLTQPQKLAHQHPDPSSTPGSWTWNRRRVLEEDDGDDSWEVRAFAEDTGSIMGTTWPPRSYTCRFCRREFQSAQALGGHMNVHRRDRARLRQLPPMSISPLIFPTQESISSAGLCLRYPFSAPTSAAKGCMESPSTLLSISPYTTNNMTSSCLPSTNTDASVCNLSKIETLVQDDKNDNNDDNENDDDESAIEEVDLELRLGQKPLPH